MLKMHIFLVGMAGAGKTSLGRRLATNLNIPFVDTDQRISEIMGMSVIEIFQTLGEQFFRNAEAGVLMELIGKPPCVVSTGGGLPTVRENVLLMQNHGVIIHVDRPLDQVHAHAEKKVLPDSVRYQDGSPPYPGRRLARKCDRPVQRAHRPLPCLR